MSSIFVSYAQQDQPTAKRIAQDLAKRGILVWFDEEEILVGDSILERIKEGIRSSEYLLVILSRNSAKSVWVEREIRTAFNKFGDEAKTAIIPVLIDDSPVPTFFSGIRYVNLKNGYENALSEIILSIERDKNNNVKLNTVIDAEDFASDLAGERSIPKGKAFYVTGALAILSILATLIAAWPSFYNTFTTVPKVYYDFRSDSVTSPPGADEKEVIKALKAAGIAPSALRIRVINKGKSPAKNVKIGSKTDGHFLYINSTPSTSSKTVWVKITVDNFNSGDNEAVVQLKDLVPERKVVLDFGYEPTNVNIESDVVSSGSFAERVPDIDNVPQWTILKSLEFPLQIFISGILLSIFTGITIAARSNPRLGKKIIDLFDAIFPFYSSILRILLK